MVTVFLDEENCVLFLAVTKVENATTALCLAVPPALMSVRGPYLLCGGRETAWYSSWGHSY